MSERLFSKETPLLAWDQFDAQGFSQPVSGVIFSAHQPPCCGVPLGGISTGCLDIDARGVYGFSSIFNPVWGEMYGQNWRLPRKPPKIQPILGLSVADTVWLLTTPEMVSGYPIPWCTEPRRPVEKLHSGESTHFLPVPDVEEVQTAREIYYWGHFPVADLEFETDAPISVGLRAWAPFIPGDLGASNTPAAVFQVHLRNITRQRQSGTLAFNFPGPSPDEARDEEFTRQVIHEDFHGVVIGAASASSEVQYALGVIGEAPLRLGAGLSSTPSAWSKIASGLPQPKFRESNGLKRYQDPSASVAVDFTLEPEESTTINFLLAWYAPVWEGNNKEMLRSRQSHKPEGETPHHHYRWIGSEWEGGEHYFSHMYATHYGSVLDVARRVATEHESLLKRVLSWQEVIYSDQKIPTWLKDSLVNSLALIAEDSYWAQPKPPLGDWAFPEGVFGLLESPRGCPDIACIPCDWYGNLPVVFFFPDLYRTTLRAFKQFQKKDGEIPFLLGLVGDLPEMAVPGYHWQVALNGMCYVDLVGRLWLRTGDDSILDEFYESAKHCNTFTMNLSSAPNHVISMPDVGGMEWFEFGEWAGMATHMGGLRLAELLIMERMAEAVGDTEYAKQCRIWLAQGQRAMEEELWAGSYYLNFYDKENNKKSDHIMAYQLDGEWAARYHGFSGAFQTDRVKIALETIKNTNVALTPDVGAANFVQPDGSPLSADSAVAAYGVYAMFPPELVILAMTYIYAGEKRFGLELARKHWENLVIRQRHPWDLPNIVNGDSGERTFGTDYYQNTILWALPAALDNQDLAASCQPDGLVDRIIRASSA
ncbi:MAG: GH116 family glycosyl-hydrolase [Anaerolineales bacterium]|jgi:uncharacterized protein (DUF608 family)